MRPVQYLKPCDGCGGAGEVQYTWSNPGPDTCRKCDGSGEDVGTGDAPPDSWTEAAVMLALAAGAVAGAKTEDERESAEVVYGVALRWVLERE